MDILAVKIIINFHSIYLLVIYIPPTCTREHHDILFNAIIALHCIYGSDVLILGDFNIPEYITCHIKNTSSQIVSTLLNFCNFFNLQQYNFVPNSLGRVLDLVLSNRRCVVKKAPEIILLEDVHHPALVIEIDINKITSKTFPNRNNTLLNCKKTNFITLY